MNNNAAQSPLPIPATNAFQQTIGNTIPAPTLVYNSGAQTVTVTNDPSFTVWPNYLLFQVAGTPSAQPDLLLAILANPPDSGPPTFGPATTGPVSGGGLMYMVCGCDNSQPAAICGAMSLPLVTT